MAPSSWSKSSTTMLSNRDDAAKAVEALHGRPVDGPSLAVSFKYLDATERD
jgi:hypothetical protein